MFLRKLLCFRPAVRDRKRFSSPSNDIQDNPPRHCEIAITEEATTRDTSRTEEIESLWQAALIQYERSLDVNLRSHQ